MRRLAAVGLFVVLVLSAGCLAGFSVESDGIESDGIEDDGTDADGFGPNQDLEPVDADLSVHYIDVGQADATFVRGPDNETMLIDSGDYRDDGEAVIAYLEARGVERIDYMVSTHAHADHIGGSAAVIRHFETEGAGIGAIYDSGVPHTSATYSNYLEAIEEHDVTLYETQAGDEIPMNGTNATVLNPPAGHGDEDLDANAVVVRIGYGDAGFLFTGDMTSETENDLVDRWGDDLQSSVYQVGHHGSETSSSPAFLDAVHPRIAIVSAAYDSQYGHPDPDVLERLADRGIATYWTGTHGTIVASTDGDDVTVRTVADAPTDPTSLRDAAAVEAAATAPVEVRGTYDVGTNAGALVGPGSVAEAVPIDGGPNTDGGIGGVAP
jgi:competence protein ComEC